MPNQSPSSNEGWSDVVRELLKLPDWEIQTREPSEKPGWEKITFTNGTVFKQPIPPKQLELFSLKQDEDDVNSELLEVISDSQIAIKPELLQSEEATPPPGNVNEYYPGKRKVAYFRLSYRVGKRVKHKHIRGGNVFSQAGQANAQKIRVMVNRRCSLGEILSVISSF